MCGAHTNTRRSFDYTECILKENDSRGWYLSSIGTFLPHRGLHPTLSQQTIGARSNRFILYYSFVDRFDMI